MLEVRLLGQFDVRLNGAPMELSSRPAQSLFAYLLLNPDVPHRREKLAGLLWPDTSDANARNSLRHALWALRRAVGDGGYIVADDLTITLDTSRDFWLDAIALERKTADEVTADNLLDTVSLYGGDLLPGFYDDWIVLDRERVQAVFERKMKLLLDKLVGTQRWQDVLEWGERWIALGYVSEPAYRALMQAHAGLGDMASAAAAYQRCVETLKKELGVEPSEQTRLAYDRLARGEGLPAPQAVPAPAIVSADEPPAPGRVTIPARSRRRRSLPRWAARSRRAPTPEFHTGSEAP